MSNLSTILGDLIMWSVDEKGSYQSSGLYYDCHPNREME